MLAPLVIGLHTLSGRPKNPCALEIYLSGSDGTVSGEYLLRGKAELLDTRPKDKEDVSVLTVKPDKQILLLGSMLTDSKDGGKSAYVAGYEGTSSSKESSGKSLVTIPVELKEFIPENGGRVRFQPLNGRNPEDGMSGGPIVNQQGLIVGVNVGPEQDKQKGLFRGVPTSTICGVFAKSLSAHCKQILPYVAKPEAPVKGGTESGIGPEIIRPVPRPPTPPIKGLW
jgi:hypothetical protein